MATTTIHGRALQTYRAFDFSGGLDVQTAPTKLAQLKTNKWLTTATNVIYNTDGSVGKRWGMVQKSAAMPGVGDTNRIMGGIRYVRSSGTVQDVIAVANGNVYTVASDTTLTSVKSGLTTAGVRPHFFAVYNDILHMGNGVDAPQQYDGTTWAALGGSSPATAHVFVAHGNRLFATATAVPSRLYWSKLNNSLDWSGTADAGFLDLNPNDGGTLKALVPSINELVLLKTNRPYRLQGVGPVTGYTVADNLVPTVGSIGATSPTAGAFGVNTVFYGSQQGVHSILTTQSYGDLDAAFLSARLEPYFRVNAPYAPVNPYAPYDAKAYQGYSFLGGGMMAYDGRENLLFYGQQGAAGSVACDRLLVYDLNRQAWSHWYGGIGGSNNNLTCLFTSETQSAARLPELCVGLWDPAGTGTAVLAAFRRDATSDITMISGTPATAAIEARVRHVSNLGAPQVEKAPRYLYLYFAKEAATTTMTLTLYADFKTTAVFTTTFDITSSTAEKQVIKRIDLPSFLCEYLEVDLQQATTGKGFTLYGYEVQWRARRTIRRAE